MLRDIFNSILNLIYPNKCVLCNNVIVKRKEYTCNFCSKSFKTDTKIRYLNDLSDFSEKTIKCVSPFEYAGKIKNAIWRFKFRGYKNYSEFFAKIIAEELQSNFKNITFDYITFVPLRRDRKRDRGYNQSQCLAVDLSSETGIPCKDLLLKIKETKIQHELSMVHRRENVKGAFAVNSAEKENIKNKVILVCDDIITSGSTLYECVKILLESGAKSVYCCTIAYIPKLSFSNKHQ